MIRKILYLLVAVIIITGCASAPDSATQAPIGLKYFVGVWKLEESYLSDNIEYNYLVIKSDNTIESWTDRGLEQLYTMNPEWKELAYKTFSAAVSEWEGDEVSLDASLREKKLHLIFTAEDQTRQWVQVFDSVETLPEFNIDNDFENGNLKYISSYNFGDGAEWQIIDDPDDSNNSVLAPVLADTNSDADIQLSPGKNFTIEFDMKRKSEKISGMDSVSGLNFDIYRPMDITNDSSKVNNEEYIEFDFDPEMTQDIWYRIKVTVLEGRYFKFFRNEILFGEGEIDEAF
ncbi:MAG: hypothetical protein PF693_10070, partial [Spirochaetia bacterium]|nr:hypothetical protein [Spirochaetia bacterium]